MLLTGKAAYKTIASVSWKGYLQTSYAFTATVLKC